MTDFRDEFILYQFEKMGFKGSDDMADAALNIISFLESVTRLCELKSNNDFVRKAVLHDGKWYFPLTLDGLHALYSEISDAEYKRLLQWLDEKDIISQHKLDDSKIGYSLNDRIRVYLK